MRTASITVHLQRPIATIQPQLHGQFIEHLGTCIYDGIWVGERSSIPNINGIRRSGTPRELSEWVEYCNYAGNTTITQRRVVNGAPEPFGVRFWGIGNESWECGGKFHPETYADAYKRFESHFPRFEGQPLFLIACGPDGNKPHENAAWTEGFFKRLSEWRWPRIHGYDAHFYTWNMRFGSGPVPMQAVAGSATNYTVDQG